MLLPLLVEELAAGAADAESPLVLFVSELFDSELFDSELFDSELFDSELFDSELPEPDSLLSPDDLPVDELLALFAAAVEERESVTYQPLPLKTMPTGWMTLRSVPPQCSQVVSGGSEKLCRFSVISLHAVQEYV